MLAGLFSQEYLLMTCDLLVFNPEDMHNFCIAASAIPFPLFCSSQKLTQLNCIACVSA
jgi:hypothetical protein